MRGAILLCVLCLVTLTNWTLAAPADSSSREVEIKPLNEIWSFTEGKWESDWKRKGSKVELEWRGAMLLQLRARSFVTPSDKQLIVEFENHFQNGRLFSALSLLNLNDRPVCNSYKHFDFNGGAKQSIVLDLNACDLEQVNDINLAFEYEVNRGFQVDSTSTKLRILNIYTV